MSTTVPVPDRPDDLALSDAFAQDSAESDKRRLRVLMPVMAVLHTVHIVLFHDSAARRATLPPDVALWRQSIVGAHAIMLPIVAWLLWLVYFERREQWVRLAGPITAAAYVGHGALCSSFDQLVTSNMTPYVGYCLGAAFVLNLRPRVAIPVYALGAAAMTAGVMFLQSSPQVRWANLPNAATASVVGVVISWLACNARRRDLTQRVTIDRQSAELSRLNRDLEQRVREQVAEIVRRAAEVERLNAQLQAQVRSRSGELSLALARLAKAHSDDGSLRPGLVLGERFVVGERLGSGGMGAVYSGTDRTTGERVAIKVIQATSSDQLDAMRRFIQEAGAAAAVTHPAVVRMLHVDVADDGLLFQVQELVAGDTLARRIRQPWPGRAVARLGSVLCDALAAAHAGGVVHRDVKPENVMLTPSAPGLKLLDFGIAKLYDAVSGAGGATTGMLVGTPSYMAPEQISADGTSTDKVDVYAVGVLLFRLLTGRMPFVGSSAREILNHHMATPAPDARQFDVHIPAELAAMVARCLDKEPEARPSASELAQWLGTWADKDGALPLHDITGVDVVMTDSVIISLDTPTRRSAETG